MFLLNKTQPSPRLTQPLTSSKIIDDRAANGYWSHSSLESLSTQSESNFLMERPGTSHGHTRRISVFPLRSRSNTSGQSNTVQLSRTATLTGPGDTLLYSSSRDNQSFFRNLSNSSESADPKSKSLFSRGRRSKRQSKLDLAASNEVYRPESDGRASAPLRRTYAERPVSGYLNGYKPRPYISAPFDFQHLTHTNKQQFPMLERASQNELVAEFWAVRASQRPRAELHGIKAEDLRSTTASSDVSSSKRDREHRRKDSRNSPTQRAPQIPRDVIRNEASSPTFGHSLRQSRSIESFSQPYIKSRSPTSANAPLPPPRVSSRMGTHSPSEQDQSPAEKSSAPSTNPSSPKKARHSGNWERPPIPKRSPTGSGAATSVCDSPHAVTTLDDVAILPTPSNFGNGLENVPEESESQFKSATHPVRPRSPESPGLIMPNNRKSGSLAKYGKRQNSPRRPMSQMSDTLGSPFTSPARRISSRIVRGKRQSEVLRGGLSSWEDDIDYCYDLAAEADCDFDWDRGSPESKIELSKPAGKVPKFDRSDSHHDKRHDKRPSTPDHSFPPSLGPSLLVTDSLPPELDSSSEPQTTSTEGAITPRDVFDGPSGAYAAATKPFGDGKEPIRTNEDLHLSGFRDDIYEDLIADYESSCQQYPIISGELVTNQVVSPRESQTHLSKRSSYDSSYRSARTASTGSRHRRSTGSVGSLPDLVWSRQKARPSDSIMLEQLTEQIKSFAYPEKDANDEAVEDERDEPTPQPLRIASQSSNRSLTPILNKPLPQIDIPLQFETSPIQHDRSASDGVAKLFDSFTSNSSIIKESTHKRTASSAQAHKVAGHLSLFPVATMSER